METHAHRPLGHRTMETLATAAFVALEPTWSFGDALYHCLVTVSTVGYGDQ